MLRGSRNVSTERKAHLRGIRRTNEFHAEQVLSRSNAAWDGERHLSLIGDKSVNAPLPTGVQAILVDLEPLQPSHGGLCRRWNLGTERSSVSICTVSQVRLSVQVGDDGTLVGRVNWVGGVASVGAIEGVMPLRGHLGACGD